MSEMVERVARAVYEDWRLSRNPKAAQFDNIKPSERHLAMSQARAAIAAMREPTDAMMEVLHRPDDWSVLIDAALSDPPQTFGSGSDMAKWSSDWESKAAREISTE